MKLEIVRQLHRVKTLHANRAEEEQRTCLAAFNAALAGIETARRTLAEWRAEMPRRQAAIYDAIIGQLVGLDALEEVKAKVAALREHEGVLVQRLADAEKAAKEARARLDAAEARLAEARRAVTKFEDLVEMLRRLALAEAEFKEDAELEAAAEASYRRTGDGDEGDGWDHAA